MLILISKYVSSLYKSLSVSLLCTDFHLFDHYADHQMGTAVKVIKSLMHNTVVYIYLHSYKINILICNSKTYSVSKETIMHIQKP